MITGCFDFSTHEATLVLVSSENAVLWRAQKAFEIRRTGDFIVFLKEAFEAHEMTLESVSCWRIGMGPGTFSTLRMSASFFLGLQSQRPEITLCGVPSAFGVLHNIPAGSTRVTVLYDGKNNEFLYYGLTQNTSKKWQPNQENGVIAHGEIERLYHDAALTVAAPESLRKWIPESLHNQTHWVTALDPVDFMHADHPFIPLQNPIYLRNAVFVDPMRVRTDL